jgi:tRNA pseudouridine65 synthase
VQVLALTTDAARSLGDAFAAGAVHKVYWALVRGVPQGASWIDHPIPAGEDKGAPRVPAQTWITPLRSYGRYSLVEARPKTGRLHQVRRHLKHISCPLIRDVNYGKSEHNRLFRERFGLHRIFLHAREITLPHPTTGESLTIAAPLPPELTAVLAGLNDERMGEGG